MEIFAHSLCFHASLCLVFGSPLSSLTAKVSEDWHSDLNTLTVLSWETANCIFLGTSLTDQVSTSCD